MRGGGGNDFIDGGPGQDNRTYSILSGAATTGPITVHLAAEIVTGDASVGTDTLRSIEQISGTNFADIFDATGFSGSSINAGSNGTFNLFTGFGGDDIIIGNGNTQIFYSLATGAVTVDIAGGVADGDVSTGHDTFSGVFSVVGSNFNDVILGDDGNNRFRDSRAMTSSMAAAASTSRSTARGRRLRPAFRYTGIVVDLADGIVTGDASIGTDTLWSIENIGGTSFNDVYNATGFDGSSLNAGDYLRATLNQYVGGQGGDDLIIGNGDTGLNYSNAAVGVTVDMVAGTASYGTSHDSFSGVAGLVGSNFDDTLYGSDNVDLHALFNVFQPLAGNDFIEGRDGMDIVYYGTGAGSNVTSGITVHLAKAR